ncbi:MAG: hypothetical protein COA42_17520, partial [Alteromonadaceae bacterium]
MLISLPVQSAVSGVPASSAISSAISSDGNPTLSTQIYSPKNTKQNSDQVDIVLVDQALEDQILLKQAAANADHYILFNSATDSAADIITNITDWALQNQQTISSISILSHGNNGSFQLGFDQITKESIAANISLWQKLAGSMSIDGNIYLYSCEAGKGSEGQALIDTLASVTESNIFASSNITGFKNDWSLEIASAGSALDLASETNTPLDEKLLAHYSGTLGQTTSNYPTANNSVWNSPTNAYADNNNWATSTNNKQQYYNFSLSIPATALIKGISMSFQGKGSGGIIGSVGADFDLSWNGGTNWSSQKSVSYGCFIIVGCGSSEETFGNSTDLWGSHNWTPDDLSNTNFRLRVEPSAGFLASGMRLDYVRIQVHYSSVSAADTTISVSGTSLIADGVTTSTITVQAKDDSGADFTSGGHDVDLYTTGNATISVVTDNTNGTYTATITNTTAQAVTISGDIESSGITSGDATVTFTPGAAVAAQSTMSVSPATVIADGSTQSTITVQAKDVFGNSLTSGASSIVFSETSSATISSVSIVGNGTYTATITNVDDEVVTVSATLDGGGIANTSDVTFNPGPAAPSKTTITASPTTVTADGSSTSTITVQTIDANDNDLTAGGLTVVLTPGGSAAVGTVSYIGGGAYSATVTNTVAEAITVTGSMDTGAIIDTAAVAFIAGASDPTQAIITVSSASSAPDGSTVTTITVEVKDANGNAVSSSGGTVVLTPSGGTAIIGVITDHADGTYTATITNTTVETVTVIGTMASTSISDTADVEYTLAATYTVNSTITPSSSSIAADGITTSTITVQIKDAGNADVLTGGMDVALTVNGGAILTGLVDNSDGSYTATVTNTTAEPITVSGTINDVAIADTAAITFNPGAATTAETTITASPTTVIADGSTTSTMTVQTKDVYGNSLTTDTATIALSQDGSAILGIVSYAGGGAYTATITNSTTETVTVSGTISASSITDTEDVIFAAGSVNGAQSVISVSAASQVAEASGVDAATITVQAKDAFGNNLSTGGLTVVLSSTGSGVISSIINNGDGTYTATITNTTIESVTISGTVSGQTIGTTDTVNFVDSAPGGIAGTLKLWLDADAGVTEDANGVTGWADQSGLGKNAVQGGGDTYEPTLNAAHSDMNFHQSLAMDGTQDYLTASNVTGTTNGYLAVFIVTNINASSGSDNTLVGFGSSEPTNPRLGYDSNGRIEYDTGGTKQFDTGTNPSQTMQYNEPIIYHARISFSGTPKIKNYLNGHNNSKGNHPSSGSYSGNGTFYIGGVNNDNRDSNGDFAEVLVHSSSSVKQSGDDRKRIFTNLAIKYGITLVDQDYIDASLAIIYDMTILTTHTKQVFGIAKKVSSSLNQRISKGWYYSGSGYSDMGLIVSTDTDYSSASASHADTIIDGSYLLMGHDGAGITLTTSDLHGDFSQRIDREWRVAHTGTIGAVNLYFANLPALAAGEKYVLIEDSDTTFSNSGYSAAVGTSTDRSFENVTLSTGTNYITVAVLAAPSGSTTTITPASATVTADGTSTTTITIQAKNASNVNLPLGGDTVVLTDNGDAVISAVTDNGDGTYTATITSTKAEAITISGTINGNNITPNTGLVTFEAGAPDASQTIITVSPTSRTADGTTADVTMQAVDAFGNLLTGGAFAATISGNGSQSFGALGNNGDGTASATISNLVAETVTISGTINSAAIADTATITFDVGAADAATTQITVSDANVAADGTSTSTITVQAKDANNNNLIISGGLVTLSATGGATVSTVTNYNNGTYVATITNTVGGAVVISGTIAGPAITDTAGVTFSDSNPPTMVNNTGATVDEGSSVTITTTILSATDVDTADSTLIYTVSNLDKGTIEVSSSSVLTFTQQNLIDGVVEYVHDDSNSTTGGFDFTVKDPTGNTLGGQGFSVTVNPVDDDAPTIVNNISATVDEGNDVVITTTELSATDTDASDATILYTASNLSNGIITLGGSTVTTFTQQNLIDGVIKYVHSGSDTLTGGFDFTIQDPSTNTLGGLSFSVIVNAVDDLAPTIVNNISATVNEGDEVVITTTELSATDTEAAVGSIIYTASNLDNGTITVSGGTVTTFTQQNLIDGVVKYVHDDSNTTSGGFDFTIQDPTGNTLGSLSFAVIVNAIDDEAPTIVNGAIATTEGATETLALIDLSAIDNDTADSTTLIYTVGDVSHGTLTINSSPWSGGNNTFTQQDIIDGNVVYSHDHTNNTADFFSFTVEDPSGNTSGALTFTIFAAAVDDDFPTIVNNVTPTFNEGATHTILNTQLSATDTEDTDANITYTVTSEINGHIELSGGAA